METTWEPAKLVTKLFCLATCFLSISGLACPNLLPHLKEPRPSPMLSGTSPCFTFFITVIKNHKLYYMLTSLLPVSPTRTEAPLKGQACLVHCNNLSTNGDVPTMWGSQDPTAVHPLSSADFSTLQPFCTSWASRISLPSWWLRLCRSANEPWILCTHESLLVLQFLV